MAIDKNSVILYCDIIHTVEKLSDEQAGKLFKHYLRYVNDLNPVMDDIIIDVAFEPIKQQLKRDLKHWESVINKRSKAGKASAEKRKQNKQMLTHVKSVKQKSTNSTVNVNDNVNVNVNDIEEIYNMYPSKCPIKNSSTGKSTSHKKKIKILLKEYSVEELKHKIEWYVTECKNSKTFLKNFGTFLNNLPDIEKNKIKHKVKTFTVKHKLGPIKKYEIETLEKAKEKYCFNFGCKTEEVFEC